MPKSPITKKDLEGQILRHISLRSRSDDPPEQFLTKGNIIKTMTDTYEVTEEEVENAIEDLEGDEKIKLLESNVEIYALKSEVEKIKGKLKEKFLYSGVNTRMIFYVAAFLSVMIMYYYPFNLVDLQSIESAYRSGGIMGVAAFFVIILIIKGSTKTLTILKERGKAILGGNKKELVWNAGVVALIALGIVSYFLNQSLITLISFILAGIAALKIKW